MSKSEFQSPPLTMAEGGLEAGETVWVVFVHGDYPICSVFSRCEDAFKEAEHWRNSGSTVDCAATFVYRPKEKPAQCDVCKGTGTYAGGECYACGVIIGNG